MGEMRGIMNLCIPYNTIEPLASKLSSDAWSAYTKRAADPRQRLDLETGVAQAKVEMVVRLAETTITAGEIASLSIGDVIVTEQPCNQGLKVVVEGRPTFLCSPGAYKGHRAARILNPITRLEDRVKRKLSEGAESAHPKR
jgi:flagellar motor switch protein FliM